MRVLVIGGGGREHALTARLAAEPDVDALICAPGNPGIASRARTVPIDVADVDALARLAAAERVDLTIVGPELPLSRGVADRFTADGRALFGPTAAAARLESTKAFAKEFMARHRIPTARFRVCRDLATALAIVQTGELGFPLVVKADGLASGKGVIVAGDAATAEAAVLDAMGARKFGAAGDCLVLEECLTGPEVSFFALCDGRHAVPFGTAQDYKRIFDEDRGANTGGMGAFAPSPLVDTAIERRIMRDIVDPVIAGMAAEGSPFRGFLYVGLMLTADGPKVIEFNVRLGDPEAQVILSLVDEPLLPLLAAAARGDLRPSAIAIRRETRVAVVIASRGYPDSSESGCAIAGVDAAAAIPGVAVYHAGTAMRDGRLVTAGGRVLTVVGRGVDYVEAAVRAYVGVLQISFDGMQYRRDIGGKAVR